MLRPSFPNSMLCLKVSSGIFARALLFRKSSYNFSLSLKASTGMFARVSVLYRSRYHSSFSPWKVSWAMLIMPLVLIETPVQSFAHEPVLDNVAFTLGSPSNQNVHPPHVLICVRSPLTSSTSEITIAHKSTFFETPPSHTPLTFHLAILCRPAVVNVHIGLRCSDSSDPDNSQTRHEIEQKGWKSRYERKTRKSENGNPETIVTRDNSARR